MPTPPDDSRLTAAALGELKDAEAAAVAREAAADPAMQAELEEIRALQQFLTRRLPAGDAKLLPHQRENVLRAAREAAPARRRFSAARLQVYFIPAAAAAVLALATVLLVRMSPAPPAATADAAARPATPPAPAPPPAAVPEPPPAPAEPPVPAGRGSLAATEVPVLELPVTIADRNYGLVATAIRERGKLPEPGSVRLEEILNHFTYRFTGMAAIARPAAANWHPDTRGNGITRHLASLSTETLACPWKPSATLLLIHLRGNEQAPTTVNLRYRAHDTNVVRYRLLGFPGTDGPATTPDPALPAGARTTLALEIQALNPRGPLGTLEWTAGDSPAPPVAISLPPETEPSDDARFAAVVCTFAQWLAGEQAGVIDDDILAALAREIATPDLPAARADFLSLIDRALRLR